MSDFDLREKELERRERELALKERELALREQELNEIKKKLDKELGSQSTSAARDVSKLTVIVGMYLLVYIVISIAIIAILNEILPHGLNDLSAFGICVFFLLILGCLTPQIIHPKLKSFWDKL